MYLSLLLPILRDSRFGDEERGYLVWQRAPQGWISKTGLKAEFWSPGSCLMLWEIIHEMNIKQDNARFNEAKVHTWEASAGEFRLISPKDVWLVGFCSSRVKSQRCGTDISSLFPLSRQGAWFPTFSYLVFLELSWHLVPDGSYSICNADGVIIIL